MTFLPTFGIRKAFNWVAITATLVFGIQYWLNHKSYVFDDRSIAAIARKHVVLSPKADIANAYEKVLHDLRSKYKGHILPNKDLQWVFMNAGGWMGSMCLLHASLTEYLLFFGTAVDTSGHSGRYWANISDTILTGKMFQWKEGTLKSIEFQPGDTVFHEWGEVTGVSWPAGTWMVEYGRGFIPSTLVFALADTVFSTTDFVNTFYILRVYAKALMMEAGFYLSDLRQFVKDML
ncbi:hypothetical protein EGW08_013235 [Elysia chlorotica]|uniref:Sigma non-opioid intracellular receptor 1 n=1 Tax=Elysia chlorotica TaxID=188477 RepID=A0A3S1B3I0_ELYCH|nr:hypothetical protein EGW08_013235 [Elysia chlorotica]